MFLDHIYIADANLNQHALLFGGPFKNSGGKNSDFQTQFMSNIDQIVWETHKPDKCF